MNTSPPFGLTGYNNNNQGTGTVGSIISHYVRCLICCSSGHALNLHLQVSTRASLFMLFHGPRAELYFSEVATEPGYIPGRCGVVVVQLLVHEGRSICQFRG